jgi:FkbM family methyltransferase
VDSEFKLYNTSRYVSYSTITSIQLNRLQKKNLVAVEIGAFKGDDVSDLCQQFGSRITIYAIEACPTNFTYLRKRFKRFKKIVRPRKLVISNIDGTEKFYVAKYCKSGDGISSKGNSLYESALSDKSWVLDYKQLTVPSQTLDTFCDIEKIDCIDLLKINCEGGEYRIFSKKKIPFLRKTNILDIAIHGKSRQFLSPKFIAKKYRINSTISNHGFELIYGYDLRHLKYCPINHIRQIWIKKDIFRGGGERK